MKRLFLLYLRGVIWHVRTHDMCGRIYRFSNRAEAAHVLNDVGRIRNDVTDALVKGAHISAHFYDDAELASISPKLAMLYRGKDGSLIFKSSPRGILFWLYPETVNGKIKWKCYGGSNRDVPTRCRSRHECFG